jgi:hypothetical protein
MSRSLKRRVAVQQDQGGWPERARGNDDSRGRPAGRTAGRKVPMTFLTRTIGVALVALASVVVADAARAATAMQQCAVAKLRAAGKEVGTKMVCYAKAKKAATSVDSTCLQNAQTKADASINRVDGACAGTATEIDAAVDLCVSAFLTDDPGNGACPALSAKVIGKGAKGELVCQAKNLTTPGTFAACDMAEDAKTTVRLGNAGGGTPCVSITSVMTDIDNCDTAIGDALVTTTTTSTTTTTLPCGGGYPTCGGTCPAGQSCGGTCFPFAGCECQCVPSDVCAGSEPTCGGPCPAGAVCGQRSGGNICECVSSDETCLISDAPACGGTCPTGQVCGARSGSGTCECVNSGEASCDFSQAPTCGGACPSGQVCGQATGGSANSCKCVNPDETCAISQAPACGGTCPTGNVCGPLGGGGIDCVCVSSDNTCTISQAPACGGTCPTGQVCGQALGSDFCRCVPSDSPCGMFDVCAAGTCPAGEVCGPFVGNPLRCACHS